MRLAFRLPQRVRAQEPSAPPSVDRTNKPRNVDAILLDALARVTGLELDEIDKDANLSELGIDSIRLRALAGTVAGELGVDAGKVVRGALQTGGASVKEFAHFQSSSG